MKFKKAPIAASLALCLLIVGAVGTTAFAASPDSSALPATSPQAQTQAAESENAPDAEAVDTDDVNDEHVDENDNGTETGTESETDAEDAQAQADLVAQAKITEAEAIAAAEQANSGYTFTADELDSENGIITYDLKGTDANGGKLEVKVNATDGTIMQEADGEYEG
ncbi:MAG: PepSY domain-containing protein [Petrimonas sp.]|nr:PepSY domain-containing protein [Petrimonas sp.]